MNLGELKTRTLERLGQDPATAGYFTPQEVIDALNEGQRLFALATLCLETNVTFPLNALPFHRMLATYPDWLVPLRVTDAATGERVEPATMAELHALDSAWISSTTSPKHYGCLGFDLLFVNGATGSLSITYAQSAPAMVADADPAVIIGSYHSTLIDYAIGRVRADQGGQEFGRAMPYFARFITSTQAAAGETLARSLAAGYDRQPFELSHFNVRALSALKKAPK